MNIEKIKEKIENNKQKNVRFKFNGNRNQIEEFEGKIINTYKSVFIIKLNNNDLTKSFTYTDILIGNLEIK